VKHEELEKILEIANKTIDDFRELVYNIVENKTSDNVAFYDYYYGSPGEAISDFAIQIFNMVGEMSEKRVDCGEDGYGYIITTDSGKKVVLLVFDTNVIDIIAIPRSQASFCTDEA
jgi:hypothetical protein